MKRLALCLLAAACVGPRAGATGAEPARAPAARRPAPPPFVRVDPLSGGGAEKPAAFAALERELARAMGALGKLRPAPYYLAYHVHDYHFVNLAARNGALLRSAADHRRMLTTDLRVGDHHFDSSRPSPSVPFRDDEPAELPLGDDEAALRAIAWRETDQAYKAAVERYAQLRGHRAVKVDREDSSDDFSLEPPVVFLERPVALAIDLPAWEQRLRRLSGRFRRAPEIATSQVGLIARDDVQWSLSAEGTAVQTNKRFVAVRIEAGTRTEDGTELARSRDLQAATPEGLPDEAAMAAVADEVLADLQALRRAPVAEPYVGPAIFSGPSAAVLFHEAFGHRAEASRLRDDTDGQTFARKVGEPIMPAFLSVYDDPTLSKLGGLDLNGFYRFDEEGVPAQRASLVENGVLKGFLMGRAPVRGFPRSNGHGRGQIGAPRPDARMANLVVQPSEVVSEAELRRLLLAEVRRQGRPYGLFLKDITGGETATARGSARLSVKLVMVYRVWPDGRPDELVRGADLAGTPLTLLGKVLAASDRAEVFNGQCGARSGWVRQANISPSLLVGEVEIERKAKGQDRPPLLPPPAVAEAP